MDEDQVQFVTDTKNNLFSWNRDEANKITGVLITTSQGQYDVAKKMVLPLLALDIKDLQRIDELPMDELARIVKFLKIASLKQEIEKMEKQIGV